MRHQAAQTADSIIEIFILISLACYTVRSINFTEIPHYVASVFKQIRNFQNEIALLSYSIDLYFKYRMTEDAIPSILSAVTHLMVASH